MDWDWDRSIFDSVKGCVPFENANGIVVHFPEAGFNPGPRQRRGAHRFCRCSTRCRANAVLSAFQFLIRLIYIESNTTGKLNKLCLTFTSIRTDSLNFNHVNLSLVAFN